MQLKREERGWRMVDCAKRAGMTPQQWSDLENDRSRNRDERPPQPSRKTLERVAEALEVPLREVLEAVYGPAQEEQQPVSIPRYIDIDAEGKITVGDSLRNLHVPSYNELLAIVLDREKRQSRLDSQFDYIRRALDELKALRRDQPIAPTEPNTEEEPTEEIGDHG